MLHNKHGSITIHRKSHPSSLPHLLKPPRSSLRRKQSIPLILAKIPKLSACWFQHRTLDLTGIANHEGSLLDTIRYSREFLLHPVSGDELPRLPINEMLPPSFDAYQEIPDVFLRDTVASMNITLQNDYHAICRHVLIITNYLIMGEALMS